MQWTVQGSEKVHSRRIAFELSMAPIKFWKVHFLAFNYGFKQQVTVYVDAPMNVTC